MTTSWRCVLVGSESLLIQCAEALEQQGHAIAAVVTGQPSIERWAAGRGISVLRDAEALLEAPALQAFDYLFSVTNLSILSARVIALPTRAAINFHDGPLPEYAGLNTPIWALLNGETAHGVTWHLMTDAVDQGAVLAQFRFPIDAGETALTLNAKCFQAGIETFETLIADLARGEASPMKQASGPQRWFRRRDRPDAACTIRWDRDADDIARLVRALDCGKYPNPVGTAKTRYRNHMLAVHEAVVRDEASGFEPGAVVGVDDASIVVATRTRDVALTRFGTFAGEGLSPVEAAARFGFEVGGRFDLFDARQAERLTALNAAAAVHEGHWLRRLADQRPVELPYIDRGSVPRAPAHAHVDIALAGSSDAARAEAVVAAAIGYLARLTDKARFDVGYADPVLAAQFEGVEGWFAAQPPLRADVVFESGFEALREAVGAELREMRRRIGHDADLAARTPNLRAAAAPGGLPVSVVVVDRLEAAPSPASELTIAVRADGGACRWIYDEAKLDRPAVEAMQGQFATLLAAADAAPDRPLAELPLIAEAQRAEVLASWNGRAAPRRDACVHNFIAEQTARTPDRAAVTCGEASLSYAELDRRANQLARRLAALGVGPDVLVGLHVERSLEMMVGLLAIQKAGGAYVPLDPDYPKDRLRYMVEDSGLAVLLTQERLAGELATPGTVSVRLDSDWPAIAAESAAPFDGGARPHNLAYVIYTSGSTGKPKGVMVEHRNVANFFAGMDAEIGGDGPGVWLAVTSLSFDISVLELCWTLARGYGVVLYTGEDRAGAAAPRGSQADRPIDFSLFYFASDEAESGQNKYRLLLEGAKYADRNGFEAVWTPERHFHAFGGLYPNPSVASAAIAAVTERVKIRAGSVVLPLHHPIRVAEEWSLVDNLSNGRVGLSFASGWQPNDFVLRPENFADNKNVMLRDIDTVRRLWRGEAIGFPGALGKPVEVSVLPRPVQPELPFWVTSAGNPETFAAAGRLGANVLTHLLGQTVEELVEKLAAYRQAWAAAGHAGEGRVTLMLHSFVGPDADAVRETVRRPLIEYLRSSASLIKQYAWAFPAFKQRPGMAEAGGVDLQSLDDGEMDALLDYSFERYYETSGLFGTPEACLAMVDRIKAAGVDEVACLIDFGVLSATVLDHLPHLNELRVLSQPRQDAPADRSIAALMRRHGVTHLQCTPSMAQMLAADPAASPGLAALRRMMVGGEAFPPPLARELTRLVGGEVMNMYGPTETTIWSAVHRVDSVDGAVPLGRPLANQRIYVLDSRRQPAPPGVPGELVIGGAGVVRGYLNRPELTSERFVADPFRDGERAYRTGDLARHRADGALEFLGRLDHQVKLRGYRIELGEIEAALLGHPGVRESVVATREDTPGDVRLVAYLVPTGAKLPDATELRDRLRASLPEFMVPAHFVSLPALPKTPNGKLDRKALPAPEPARTQPTTAAFVAPADGAEAKIAAIWRDVLKLPSVGVRDNFFDLGGHSLLAVQMHRRLRGALGRELSLTDIFRFPTIQSLSAHLGQADGAPAAAVQQAQNRAQGRLAALQRRQEMRVVATADRWS